MRRALGSDTTKPPAAKPAAKPTAKPSKAAAPKQAAQLRPQVPKAPSQALSTGPQPSSASPLQVRQLVAMGFSESVSVEALVVSGGNLERAVALAASGSPGGAPLPPPGVRPVRPTHADVQQLTSMGFSQEMATEALSASGGNLDAAVQLLLSQ